MAFPNPWAVVPRMEEAPELVGWEEPPWCKAARIGDFRTDIRLCRDKDGPEYRIGYDAQRLHVFGRFPAKELEVLACIELLFMHTGEAEKYYTLSIPTRQETRLCGTRWSEPKDAARVPLEVNRYRLCNAGQTVTLQTSIPFSDLSGATPADGEEWRANIVHIPEPNTGPLRAWSPVRGHYYTMGGLTIGGAQSLEAPALIRENRMGILIFGHTPASVPRVMEKWELEWLGYRQKRLSLPHTGQETGVFRLLWQGPRGPWVEVTPSGRWIDRSSNRLMLTFHHPEAKEAGGYRLKLLCAPGSGEPDWFSIFSFDRDWLIELGEAAYVWKAQGAKPTGRLCVGNGESDQEISPEALRIISLIPMQSGFQTLGDPLQPEQKPTQALYTLSDDGQRLVSSRSGELFPNDSFPESKIMTVRSRQGTPLVYPYYEDRAGRRYFFTGRLWFEQRKRAIGQTTVLVSTDPYGAACVLLDFAVKADSWVPIANWEWNVQPLHADAVPTERSGLWSPWHAVDLTRGLTELLHVFRTVDQSDAFDRLSALRGYDVRQRIIDHLFLPSVEFVLQFPVKLGNTDPYVWQGLIEAGRTLGKPDYIHRAVEWMEVFMKSEFLADGMWKEVTLSYHSQVTNNIQLALHGLEGYNDPPRLPFAPYWTPF